MQIQVTGHGAPYPDRGYDKFELYFLRDGKPSKRVIVNVKSATELYKTLLAGKPGENYEIDLVKDPKSEHFNWTGAKLVAGDAVAQPDAAQAPARVSQVVKSTYETPEERAIRQVLIARQSCLAQAVAVVLGKKLEVADIEALAEQFVGFVHKAPKLVVDTKEIVDDIPF